MAVKCNAICTDTNQSVDRQGLNTNLTAHRGRSGSLYGGSSSDEESGGEADFSDSDEPQPAPMEKALEAQIMKSFRMAVQKGNTSLIKYYFEEHPDLQWGNTRWKNGIITSVHAMSDHFYTYFNSEFQEQLNGQYTHSVSGDNCFHAAVRMKNMKLIELMLQDGHENNIDVERALYIPSVCTGHVCAFKT